MRQIFSSPRLENVEGVAKLLTEAGIENKISESRGYRAVSRREFSYVPARQDTQPTPPSVWVVKSEDYKRARELLMDAGLLDETRTSSSYLPETLQAKETPKLPQRQRISRMRIALLFAVGAMAFWTILRMFVLR
jgi:hypothetical protein